MPLEFKSFKPTFLFNKQIIISGTNKVFQRPHAKEHQNQKIYLLF